MKIGLLDVDGHNFPNLALMKISAYHKSQGDSVEFAHDPMFNEYDIIYKSKVFTFSPDNQDAYNVGKIIKAGTGYRDYTTVLSDGMEHICPDYGLYGIKDAAYGFLTRGCVRSCPWCVVPKKEGKIRPHADIEEFLAGRKLAVLLDNNVLAHEWGLQQIEKMAKLKLKVDFNQGLDARFITPDVADMLARLRWIKRIRLACDRSEDIPVIERVQQRLKASGYNGEIACYTLIQDFREAHERLTYLKRYKWFIPHAQPYRDENGSPPSREQKDLARWANRRELYRSCAFVDYEPRKGFKCSQYFT